MESRESGLRRKQPGQRTRAGTELVSGEQCVSRPEATCPEWTGRWAVTVIPSFPKEGRRWLRLSILARNVCCIFNTFILSFSKSSFWGGKKPVPFSNTEFRHSRRALYFGPLHFLYFLAPCKCVARTCRCERERGRRGAGRTLLSVPEVLGRKSPSPWWRGCPTLRSGQPGPVFRGVRCRKQMTMFCSVFVPQMQAAAIWGQRSGDWDLLAAWVHV